jgi:hypothetical protein
MKQSILEAVNNHITEGVKVTIRELSRLSLTARSIRLQIAANERRWEPLLIYWIRETFRCPPQRNNVIWKKVISEKAIKKWYKKKRENALHPCTRLHPR